MTMAEVAQGGAQCPSDHSRQIPIYVFMIVYFILIASVGFIASMRKSESTTKLGEIKGHFAGEFNLAMVVLTTFSSVFSGYTVLGVPQDAYVNGYFSLRWIPIVLIVPAGMMILYPKMRRLAVTRKYLGPNDFIADRYRHKGLTVLTSIGVCFPQVLYMTVQLVSFAGLLGSLTLGCIDKWLGMLIFAVLALVLEKVGGMNSVVLSDSVQSVLMVIGFLLLSGILAGQFGTLGSMYNEDCSPDFINVTHKTGLFGSGDLSSSPQACGLEGEPHLDFDCQAHGCAYGQNVTRWNPRLQTHVTGPPYSAVPPFATIIGGFFWTVVNFVMFPLNPHMVQRAVLAPSDEALKVVMITLTLAPFLTMLPGIYAGIAYGTNSLSFTGQTVQSGQAMPGLNAFLLSDGSAFDYIVVGMLVCSSLAAVMSTADSVILGVANEISVSVYKGVLKPDAEPHDVVNFGTIVSVVVVGLSYVFGLFITPNEFGALSRFQNGIIFQTAPAFFVGLYGTKPASKAMMMGMVVGLIMLPLLYGIENGAARLEVTFLISFFRYLPGVNLAAFFNFITVFALYGGDVEEVDGESFPEAVDRFGPPLTADQIEESMSKDGMPGVPMLIATCCVVLLVVPYFAHLIGSTPIAGFPVWAFVCLLLAIFSAVVNISTINMWKPNPRLPTLIEESAEEPQAGIELQEDHTTAQHEEGEQIL